MNKEKAHYRILDIFPKSNWLILFCIPPIFFIYFFVIGNYLLEKTNKKNLLFQAVTIIATVFMGALFITMPFASRVKLYLSSGLEGIIVGIGLTSFFLSILLLTRITVKYERSLKEDYHFMFSDNADYVKRFFCFAYFPFTIWSFQLLANEYRKK